MVPRRYQLPQDVTRSYSRWSAAVLPQCCFPQSFSLTRSVVAKRSLFCGAASVSRTALVPFSNRIPRFARFCALASVPPTTGPYVFTFSVVPLRYCHRIDSHTNFFMTDPMFCIILWSGIGTAPVLPQTRSHVLQHSVDPLQCRLPQDPMVSQSP